MVYPTTIPKHHVTISFIPIFLELECFEMKSELLYSSCKDTNINDSTNHTCFPAVGCWICRWWRRKKKRPRKGTILNNKSQDLGGEWMLIQYFHSFSPSPWAGRVLLSTLLFVWGVGRFLRGGLICGLASTLLGWNIG